MNTPLQLALYRFYQRFLLKLPVLSEVRLATDKTLAFLKVWHYLSRAKVTGDYLEFGVFQGMSFELSLRAASRFFAKGVVDSPRFFAFDSFSGLPPVDTQRDSDAFEQGEYASSLETFRRHIRAAAKGWSVGIVPGYYETSLRPEVLETHRLHQAAFVTIDCDLFPSTLQALRFVRPLLQTGTVLYFDDWYFSGGDMTLGEPGACADWLRENPEITLVDFGNVGVMGKLFIVNICQG